MMRTAMLLCVLGALSARVSGACGPDSVYRAVGAQRLPIEFPGGVGTFDAFFRSLDGVIRRGAGKIDIVHCGGSHVQAGAYGQAMRSYFDAYAPSILRERGLVVPWEAAGTHGSHGAEFRSDLAWEGGRIAVSQHEGPFGGTGMRGTAHGAGRFSWTALHPKGSPFVCDKVLLLGSAEGLVPRWDGPPSACTSTAFKEGIGWEFTLCEPVDEVAFALVPDSVAPADSSRTGRAAFHLHGAVRGRGAHGVLKEPPRLRGTACCGGLGLRWIWSEGVWWGCHRGLCHGERPRRGVVRAAPPLGLVVGCAAPPRVAHRPWRRIRCRKCANRARPFT
jgi:hypothetical protein